jgi:CBS domain-containing protein
VSRRQLASSSNQSSAKVGSQVQHVPTVDHTEDVREVARLMIGSDAKTLPVLDDDRVVGVVTGDAVLEAVRPFLDKGKTDGQSKKHPDTDEQEQLYGWWLGG